MRASIDGWKKAWSRCAFARSKNKFGYAYILTPQGLAEKARLAQDFLARKREEYAALEAEIAALCAEMGEAGGKEDAPCA